MLYHLLAYGDSNGWNLAFSPNLDAVEEMRVSTNPTSADDGILSGVLERPYRLRWAGQRQLNSGATK